MLTHLAALATAALVGYSPAVSAEEAAGKATGKGQAKASGPDYDYEFFVSASYDQTTGSLKLPDGAEETFAETWIRGGLSCGILLGDVLEPIFELRYYDRAKAIGDYKGSRNNLTWGVGALFNLPSGDAPKGSSGKNAPRFAASTWVPYGGFLITSRSVSGKDGTTATSTLTETDMITKLVFGQRLLFFNNAALNTMVRISLDNSSSEVEETATQGGARESLTIEADLLSFSFLF